MLASVRPDDLLAYVLKTALDRTRIAGAAVDEIVIDCANQANEDNRNIARMSSLLTSIPNSVPGITINHLYTSGLSTINYTAKKIACNKTNIILAGGVESMSRAPLVMAKPEEPFARGNQT